MPERLFSPPIIGTAGLPLPERNDNDMKLKNLRSLGLVRFEFYPHYTSTPTTNQAILQNSRTTKYPIIACPDGSGITINENRMTFIGKVLMFSEGKKVGTVFRGGP